MDTLRALKAGCLILLVAGLASGCPKKSQAEPAPVSAERIESLEQRVRLLEQELAERDAAQSANGQPAKQHSQPIEEPAPSPPPATQPAEVSAPESQNPADIYRRAHALLDQGKSSQASVLFEQVYTLNPQGNLAPNALYWIGECHFDQKNFNQAILSFQQVLSGYPSASKCPDALVKLGRSREKLGQFEEAREEYLRVIERYPDARAADLAKSWLAGLP
ncbi:MAG: tol-pal system protein YbgF [Acidobacteria bacterium]|nr:tol-pal system protein YbgF [Acidobacteriota bacterium]MCB9397046.1 tol-pal system protein YbgF [Acidobacteriota bacterium]